MKLLAIETATTVCATAVIEDSEVKSEAALDEKYVHAEKLMTLVDKALVQAGCALGDVDGIAVSIGPGSFTGLRIGLSVAKGLSFAVGLNIIPVPTLHALALRSINFNLALPGEQVLAVLDARRDEVYAQLFRVEGGTAVPSGEPRDVSVGTLCHDVPEGTIVVTGDGRTKLRAVLNPGDGRWRFVPDDLARCSAASVGLLGVALMADGGMVEATTLEPLYIKEFFFRQHS